MKRFRHQTSARPFAAVLLLSLLALTAVPSTAVAEALYLHVHVEDEGGENINLNLPLATVAGLLPMLPEDAGQDGRLSLDEYDVQLSELRQMWFELRDQPDFVLASVESPESNVHVAKEGDFLVARVLEGDEARVHARIPARVVDAMLSGDGNRLDLRAALDALAAEGPGDLVTVEEDSSRVRVWVDTAP